MNRDLPSFRLAERKARVRQAEKNILLHQLKKERMQPTHFQPDKMNQDSTGKSDP